ncbi:histidine phosphatase family protein [Gordonia sp. (in: high G+C Gram-positive bacteria)]|uniref:SixA phosphatase family protein n=1 Tax=Gordonia sp. (in: high G+C Gram-positive bacteria) TaxID=84139 RepID=UPI00261C4824|nr:histidine phosphatase family protein [Gordonia sp. (in: high G+C Gram-positive bacteria)]
MTGAPRTLVLMRHGKSGYPAGVWDHDRPLADRGRREAALAGEWMAADGLEIDAVICSTAERTRQTLERTGIDAPVVYTEDIYENTPDNVLEAIRTYAPEDAGTLLVVGHFPGLPGTALTLDDAAEIDRFPTSAYAVLTIGVPWSRLGLDVDPAARMTALRVPRNAD